MNLKEELQKKVSDFAMEQARKIQLIINECKKHIECEEFDEKIEKHCMSKCEINGRKVIITPVYIQNENVVEIFDKSVPFELPPSLVSQLLQQLSYIISSRLLELGFESNDYSMAIVQAIRSYRYIEVALSW